ncbi:dolichyl-diphosphooligosaccharide--protein glycosyltransferase subunit STT3B [Prunus yedoensis var. nudiflora]|uniref:Dolichyl-diphosphooligosaccharide--protein glycosyltransferase subunit STT3B n=1 Tax=Prunus yedoensis var. nudiflora TaxID=2094558 RepID=A0A314YD57_PRUYE|nr:dolichyl-diphosphooligosaccharide--protein glycosyltransferase subunit STT3B [Prunus yedoensis var. nudiflora]
MVGKPEPVNGTATAKTSPSPSPATSMSGLKPDLLNNLSFKTLKLKTKQQDS